MTIKEWERFEGRGAYDLAERILRLEKLIEVKNVALQILANESHWRMVGEGLLWISEVHTTPEWIAQSALEQE
jgi:hypothetical protein